MVNVRNIFLAVLFVAASLISTSTPSQASATTSQEAGSGF